MQCLQVLILLFELMIFPALGYAQSTCVAPVLSDQQVKNIIEKERASRTDLPASFPKYRSTVRRQGCHYVYIEYSLPETPDQNHIFRLNQYGAIVDVTVGISKKKDLKCTNKVFSESELAKIIKDERGKRKDLPSPFPNFRTQVVRSGCLYYFFEYALPEKKGNYQVFTIDPFGELMDFSRSQPY